MREILFRGKRITDGKWVYGDYHKYTCTTSSITPTPTHYIMGTDIRFNAQILVAPDTVGQYTGLADKSGAKVFEGDIVRLCLNPKICVGAVEFDERAGAFIVKLPENKCISFLDFYVARNKATSLIWAEVIGNIHDILEPLEEEL